VIGAGKSISAGEKGGCLRVCSSLYACHIKYSVVSGQPGADYCCCNAAPACPVIAHCPNCCCYRGVASQGPVIHWQETTCRGKGVPGAPIRPPPPAPCPPSCPGGGIDWWGRWGIPPGPALYGQCCGAQSVRGGEGVDDIDKCCCAHDNCWHDRGKLTVARHAECRFYCSTPFFWINPFDFNFVRERCKDLWECDARACDCGLRNNCSSSPTPNSCEVARQGLIYSFCYAHACLAKLEGSWKLPWLLTPPA
jgi:hypothetical protein